MLKLVNYSLGVKWKEESKTWMMLKASGLDEVSSGRKKLNEYGFYCSFVSV